MKERILAFVVAAILSVQAAIGQVTVSQVSTATVGRDGRTLCFTARAAIMTAFVDSVDIGFDSAPGFGPVDTVNAPTIYITCPSSKDGPLYEMDTVTLHGYGLAGLAKDSSLVVATVYVELGRRYELGASYDCSVIFYGHSNSPPAGFQSDFCVDAGFSPTLVQR